MALLSTKKIGRGSQTFVARHQDSTVGTSDFEEFGAG
jgi:hypothetical protein